MKQKYLKNVTTLKLDTDKCNGCRMCTYVCPHNVFEMKSQKSTIQFRDNCMECGVHVTAVVIIKQAAADCLYGMTIFTLKLNESYHHNSFDVSNAIFVFSYNLQFLKPS